MCFFILLCTFLITSYFFLKKNYSEIAHLVGIFGTIGLIVILILAPWQILLLVLISVLISRSCEYYTSKLISTETEYLQQPISKFKADYNLSYRGFYYCANSNTKSDKVAISQVSYKLSYRGNIYHICIPYNAQTPRLTSPSVTYQLSYRGSPYFINKTILIKNQRLS